MAGAKQEHIRAVQQDPRWASVLGRERAADGLFFYAVKTTGIYCRPSCGARTPRPENVAFFRTGAEAEQAGFRPCRRCQPDLPPLADRQGGLIADLCRLIETAENPPDLQTLADVAGLSKYHLHRLFKAATGLTPHAYAQAHRARRVREGLRQGVSVGEAIYAAGYASSGRFYAEVDHVLGMTPGDFRAGGAENAIHFAVAECSLGAILVAASARGVCAISLGDDPEKLVRDLQEHFPAAELIGQDSAFEQMVASVVGFVEAPGTGLNLPLDIRGTAFQQRVWQALREIPAGTTLSYTELALKVGSPQAVRAVAGACAANVLAVAVPCHRVVRLDGSLSGYRWGIERKRALLTREGAKPDDGNG